MVCIPSYKSWTMKHPSYLSTISPAKELNIHWPLHTCTVAMLQNVLFEPTKTISLLVCAALTRTTLLSCGTNSFHRVALHSTSCVVHASTHSCLHMHRFLEHSITTRHLLPHQAPEYWFMKSRSFDNHGTLEPLTPGTLAPQ